jgi:phosphonate transport system ATP-binding protein
VTPPLRDLDAEPVVAVRSLTATYSRARRPALTDVSLTAGRGERVVLLGASGSGKSTLLRHVNGFMLAEPGTVDVLGTDPATCGSGELRALRAQIGCVFQRIHLVGRLSVLSNVCAGALGRLRGPRLGAATYPREVRAEAAEALARVGLAEYALRRADQLSGGQQQRVAIARMLVQRPALVLADEPVASLDPRTSQSIMQLLADVAAERGLTVVCTLHQVDLALGWGERIVGLRDGRVSLSAAVDTLSSEDVHRLYEATEGEPDAPPEPIGRARRRGVAIP